MPSLWSAGEAARGYSSKSSNNWLNDIPMSTRPTLDMVAITGEIQNRHDLQRYLAQQKTVKSMMSAIYCTSRAKFSS